MSTSNGVLSPPSRAEPSSTSATSGKRKRTDSDSHVQSNGVIETTEVLQDGVSGETVTNLLRDMVEILAEHDTVPSILDHPLPCAGPDEPSSKRTKFSEAADHTTIASKVESGSYTSLEEFNSDIESASALILAAVQPKEQPMNGLIHQRQPIAPEDKKVLAGVLAFKKLFNSLVMRQNTLRPTTSQDRDNGAAAARENVMDGESHKESSAIASDSLKEHRKVLTLMGNAPQPKQLFSSLQDPVRLLPRSADKNGSDNGQHTTISSKSPTAESLDVFLPLRDGALPNGISITEIIPIHSNEVGGEAKRIPTLGELFPSLSSLTPLAPPQPSKTTLTKDTSVGWFNPFEADIIKKSKRPGSYTTQSLAAGQWIKYNAIPPPPVPFSPEGKRKDSGPALIPDESKPPISEEAIAAHQQAADDALFRSAYSSFAPSRDDSAAVVPEMVKNRVWWNRVGERRLGRLYSSMLPQLDNRALDTEDISDHESLDEDEMFREAAESWEPTDASEDFVKKESDDEDKGVEEILKEISELLETLNSYQRIRNLTSSPTMRSSMGPTSQLATITGDPSNPSAAETEVYDTLKSQLALMIGTLPPYAVAKLNGDQLGALNISTKIKLHSKDYRGVMEDDEVIVKARTAALNAAATSHRTTTPSTASNPAPGQYPPQSAASQQAHRANYMQMNGPRTGIPQHLPGQYVPQQQTPSRRSSVETSRAAVATPQPYPAARPTSSSSQRPAYPSQYGQNNPQQYFQQATPQIYGYNQRYHPPAPAGTPSAQSRQYQQPSQPQYQQRAQSGHNFSASPSPYSAPRSASPQKAPTYVPPQQQRSSYPTPSANPARQYVQQPANPIQQPATPQPPAPQPPAPQPTAPQITAPQPPAQQAPAQQAPTPSAVGASGFHTWMTAEQQASMMERQRAQLAQQNQTQPQARVAAQANMTRQSPDTPEPQNGQNASNGAQMNGNTPAQQNVTTVATSNGE
ncbi:MAG: hypothetical protein M1819_006075 [Sarea resinae]|nr:MAG: hypothetical protein M1819_006075 [Sarea resinae]